MRCRATTKSGERCRNASREPSPYCSAHAPLESRNGSTSSSTGAGPTISAAKRGMAAGASDATAAARRLVPQARRTLINVLYASCYHLSYGVVFGAVYLARSVPSDNALVYGVRDGARAGYRQALRQEEERVARRAAGQGEGSTTVAVSRTA